ncbi:ABC transporter substrate-binding protein [Bradyrhizobium sp. DASA03068]|uniref:ABC transporter substrate-binding protein n=1 Tax=Bradyrhizobium sp. BLXBL-01 TaxID=3395915 RepID=UPI003F6FA962
MGARADQLTKIGTPLDYTTGLPITRPYHNGQRDFVALFNARGLSGLKLELLGGDHANDDAKGIALYDQMRKQGAIIFDVNSTIVAQAITRRAINDKINLITPFSGRSDAADGRAFPYVIPASPTYWSQAATMLRYITTVEGGSLNGRKIGYLSGASPTGLGQSTLPLLEMLARRYGFELKPILYSSSGDLTLALDEYIKSKPDWTLMWDGGALKVKILQYALSQGIPADRIASIIWLSEADLNQLGSAALGMLKYEGVATGRDVPLIQAIEREVRRGGLGNGPDADVGSTFYNIGVASIAIIAEGARLASGPHAKPLTAESLNEGLRSVKGFTAEGLMPPITLTRNDHQGGGAGRVSRWTSHGWESLTDWIVSDQDLVWQLIHSSSARCDLGVRCSS